MTLIEIGENIKRNRIQRGLSQEEVAKIANIDRAQLSKIERGLILGVSYKTVESIYEALDMYLTSMSDDTTSADEAKFFTDLKPFVKWAGGKTQLLNTIEAHLPAKFNNYFEPFVGGGALLFKLQPNKFVINDMNSELVMAYKCFMTKGSFYNLKKALVEHENKHSEDYYLKVRNLDRTDDFEHLPPFEHAARMIYLNKSCFNGLYRVNSKGYFNVPSGKKKIIKCFDRKNFEDLHEFFCSRKCSVLNTDFEQAVKDACEGDFVYFDPPYDTFENQDNFTSYSKNQFGKAEQVRLANLYKKLDRRGVKLMLSNHNTKFIRELYSEYHINIVEAKRMINSNGKKRGNVEEVLITNYE